MTNQIPGLDDSSQPRDHTDAQEIDGTIGVDGVRSGDLVFCARPSLLQGLCTRAGEPWRHVGFALVRDGEASVIEVSGPTFGQRRLQDVVETYDSTAVGRVAPVEQAIAARAADWCAEHLGDELVYAWDDLLLAGFIAVTRRWCLPEDQDRLEHAIAAATEVLLTAKRRREPPVDKHPGYSCSAFLLAGFIEVGGRFEFDLGAPRAVDRRPSLWELVRIGPRPVRAIEGSHISGRQSADVLRALITGMITLSDPPDRPATLNNGEQYRWATPGDLWRSRSIVDRWYLSG